MHLEKLKRLILSNGGSSCQLAQRRKEINLPIDWRVRPPHVLCAISLSGSSCCQKIVVGALHFNFGKVNASLSETKRNRSSWRGERPFSGFQICFVKLNISTCDHCWLFTICISNRSSQSVLITTCFSSIVYKMVNTSKQDILEISLKNIADL